MTTKRKNRFLISLTDDELEHVNNLAKMSGYSREAYTRMLYDKVVPPPLMTKETDLVLKELRKIGANMNHIARLLSQTVEFDNNEYYENYNRLQEQIFNLSMYWKHLKPIE